MLSVKSVREKNEEWRIKKIKNYKSVKSVLSVRDNSMSSQVISTVKDINQLKKDIQGANDPDLQCFYLENTVILSKLLWIPAFTGMTKVFSFKYLLYC